MFIVKYLFDGYWDKNDDWTENRWIKCLYSLWSNYLKVCLVESRYIIDKTKDTSISGSLVGTVQCVLMFFDFVISLQRMIIALGNKSSAKFAEIENG